MADLGSAAYHLVKKDPQAAKESLKNAGVDLVFAIVPGASVAMVKGAMVAHRGAEMIRGGSKAFKGLKYASEFGMNSYRNLRNAVTKAYGKNSGLEVHHLIEQRFAKALGMDPNKMTSVVLTKEEHKVFTKKWRELIGYDNIDKGITTSQANKELILEKAKEVYKDYPEFLKILGL